MNIVLKCLMRVTIDIPMNTNELKFTASQQSPWLLYIVTGLMLTFMTWLLIWA